MKTIISTPPHFSIHAPSLPKNPIFLKLPKHSLSYHFIKTTSFSSHSAHYNGWYDLTHGESNESPGSTQFTKLLTSLGLNDRKYAFVYVLGFVCAVVVSRVRVSSIVVIPLCVLVFAVGFSFGCLNNGGFLMGLKNTKKRGANEEFRVISEGLKGLRDLFDGFEVKFANLKSSMKNDVKFNKISRIDLVSYIDDVESIERGVLQAKNMIDGVVGSSNDASKVLNQKPGGKKGFDFSQFIAGFKDRSFGSKASKVKDSVKSDLKESERDQVKVLDPVVEDKKMKFVTSDDMVKETYGGKAMDRMGSMETETGPKQFFDRDEYAGKTNKTRFVKSERVSFNMNNRNFDRSRESEDDLLDLDFGVSPKQRRTGEYFQQEQGKYRVNGNDMLYDDIESNKKESYDESRNGNGFASSQSSEMSNDMLFNEYVTEANGLLKEAREWLTHRGIEEDAENMLYKSTELLSKAVDMKPMSLVAVGQLGNTYLLHGELKLKLSRKLRGLLAQSDSNVLDDEFSNREKFVDYLVNVCEECEELLVKAGRKYRLALSIDGDDMRALYNWGLALSFRAQLIADIGPEAAFDADKVYMAAIDKFDAMMSKSNSHTPDALFRWGVALQQRSRLRTRNFREKVKLLSQAKRLYEDALLMDSSNLQVVLL
uniref:Tetratricopeptide-like helical n=1 Tax=Tanacetum cinerariifolium TaxID=118510 RepID=A0A6L2MY99_TANCI|nr:tetratricopeptide-like helical [Tanacetum cinerariifolium]